MIICNQCGNALADDLRYCTECGASVPTFNMPEPIPTLPSPSPTQQLNPFMQTPQPSPPVIQAERKTNPLPWVLIPLGVIGLIVLVILGNNRSNQSSNDSTQYSQSYNSNYTSDAYNNSGRNSTTTGTPSYTPGNISGSGPSNTNLTANRAAPVQNYNSGSYSPTPYNSAPSGNIAFCTSNNVVVRSSPVLDETGSNKIGRLDRGDRVYVLGRSSNTDTFHGITSTWTEIQVESTGKHGFVFTYYLAPSL
ncbi:MAG TPA: hypothetical protein VK619_14605 [Pyrinomonadaceae bacterium]|nr:hypothetical protein [Pyrinomonadaceae bacterium]